MMKWIIITMNLMIKREATMTMDNKFKKMNRINGLIMRKKKAKMKNPIKLQAIQDKNKSKLRYMYLA